MHIVSKIGIAFIVVSFVVMLVIASRLPDTNANHFAEFWTQAILVIGASIIVVGIVLRGPPKGKT